MWKEHTLERTDSNLFFFGPKPVSWTTWGALTPILALPGPFKGVFGPRVGSGAPGEPNFPNNQMDPFFLVPLFLLNLKGQKRYTFDVRGQKWAQNSQNWPKIAQNSYTHMVIFWKILTSDLAANRLKYVSRTILHFDIGLGWSVHEKISWWQNWDFGSLLVAHWDKGSCAPDVALKGPKLP